MLNLTGMRHAAGVGAGIRHQLWTHTVHGTRPATPWPTYLAPPPGRPVPLPDARHPGGTSTTRPLVNAIRMQQRRHPTAPPSSTSP